MDTNRVSTESFEELKENFLLCKNVNADHRLLGGPTLTCPFTQNNSSQRMSMYISNTVQSLIARGAEMPIVASGYEREYMKYTFNSTRTKQGGTTIACIPKYRMNVGRSPIRFNPSSILIYIGEDDGQVHYMDVPRYVKCTDGFGYENIIKENFLRPGVGLPANFEIAHSRAVKGSQYGMGVNANIAYMSMMETTEDAFCMSQSLADRLGSTGVKTIVIQIDKNMIPLNLYGTSDEYKFMPDLHENVREDGLLCAFRKVYESSMISDMTDQSLMIPQIQHDELCFASEPDAVVIDVDIYRNPNRQIKTPLHIFSQAEKYIENSLYFHQQVMAVYEKEVVQARRPMSPEFNTLVTRSAEILAAHKQRYLGIKTAPKFTHKGEQVKFMYIAITYKYSNKVNKGSKSAGREGSKGVNAVVRPDEDMPINDFGVRADMVIGPEAVFNRMNIGQMYEQFITAVGDYVITQCKKMDDPLEQYKKILEYCYDVNPQYGIIVERCTDTDKKRYNYVRECLRREQLIVVVPPFLDNMTTDWALKMHEKYKVPVSPVEYNLRDVDGNLIRRIRTLRNVWIGKRYIFILCKIPHARSGGMSYINQLRIPIRCKSKKSKHQWPIGLVPLRIGEDEFRNLKMGIGKMAFRILSLYANSPDATNILTENLLTAPKPTQLNWAPVSEETIAKGNIMIKVGNHMLNTCGIDFEDVLMTKEEEQDLNARIRDAGVLM